jgi:quercetin dioxygenase-like cupin family protein
MADQQRSNSQKGLPGPTTYVTSHDQETGKSVMHSKNPIDFSKFDNDRLEMSVAYTTSFPADLNNDADIRAHEEKIKSGKLGLVSGGGTVLRYVDFAPEYECMMHRTQSVDYGIVIEGEIEAVMDSGEVQALRRGDSVVQRATMHAWRNASKTEWARMIFVLQDCQPVVLGGKRLNEDLGTGADLLQASGNDV